MPCDRLAGLVAPRRQPIGDRQEAHVEGSVTGRPQIAIDRALVERMNVNEEAESEVVPRQDPEVGAQALAGPKAPADLADDGDALLGVVREAEHRAVVRHRLGLGLGDVVEQRADPEGGSAGHAVGYRLP